MYRSPKLPWSSSFLLFEFPWVLSVSGIALVHLTTFSPLTNSYGRIRAGAFAFRSSTMMGLANDAFDAILALFHCRALFRMFLPAGLWFSTCDALWPVTTSCSILFWIATHVSRQFHRPATAYLKWRVTVQSPVGVSNHVPSTRSMKSC